MTSRLFSGLLLAVVLAATSNARGYYESDEHMGYVINGDGSDGGVYGDGSTDGDMNGGDMNGGDMNGGEMDGGDMAGPGEIKALLQLIRNETVMETREMMCARVAAKLELVNQTVIPIGIFISTNQFLPLTRSLFDDIMTVARFALATNVAVDPHDIVDTVAFLEKVLHEELIAICDLELTATIGQSVFDIATLLEELFAANVIPEEESSEEDTPWKKEDTPWKKGFPINKGAFRTRYVFKPHH